MLKSEIPLTQEVESFNVACLVYNILLTPISRYPPAFPLNIQYLPT